MTFTTNWSEPKKFEKGNLSVNSTGVYLIGYRDTTTNKRYPVYFGQGVIGDRLDEHIDNHHGIALKLAGNNRVGYYRFEVENHTGDRLDKELGLYYKYGPEGLCNENVPPGSGRHAANEIEVHEVFPS